MDHLSQYKQFSRYINVTKEEGNYISGNNIKKAKRGDKWSTPGV